MPLKPVTADQIAAIPRICYSREQIDALFAGRATITAADVLAMPIPQDDKIWCCGRAELLNDSSLQGFKAAVLGHIEPDAEEVADCHAEPHFTWVSLRRHLERTKGMTRDQIRQIVFDALVSVVNADAS